MNNTTTHNASKDRHGIRLIWPAVFSIVTCATILANILTIVVFMKSSLRRVRKRTHYLLVSLALADLMVGSISCPLFIRDLLYPNEHRETKLRLALHEVTDIISGFASILTLTSISVERLFAVRSPLKHRAASSSLYCFFIAGPWLVAMAIAVLYVLCFIYVVLLPYVMSVAAIVFLSMALIVIITAYTMVWRHVKGRQWRPSAKGTYQERKLAKTLIAVTCASLLAWLPFEVLLIVFHFCEPCRIPFRDELSFMYKGFKLLQFSNSFINTAIYSYRIPEFKGMVKDVYRNCRWRPRTPIPSDTTRSVHLTSVRWFLGSPRLASGGRSRASTFGAVIRSGQVPGNVVMNSPLLSKAINRKTMRRGTNFF